MLQNHQGAPTVCSREGSNPTELAPPHMSKPRLENKRRSNINPRAQRKANEMSDLHYYT